MPQTPSNDWDGKNLAHIFMLNYFEKHTGHPRQDLLANPDRKIGDMNFHIITASSTSNEVRAQMVAGGIISFIAFYGYTEEQYHTNKTPEDLYEALTNELKNAENTALSAADVVDDYVRFYGEG
jgi:hypothetical protein